MRRAADGAGWLAGMLFAALVVIWALAVDRDDGGYRDTFATFYRPPYDKAKHAAAAFALTLGGVWLLGARPEHAAWLVMAAGVLFECAQRWPLAWLRRRPGARPGFFSWRDVVADLCGALLAVAVLDAVRR